MIDDLELSEDNLSQNKEFRVRLLIEQTDNARDDIQGLDSILEDLEDLDGLFDAPDKEVEDEEEAKADLQNVSAPNESY